MRLARVSSEVPRTDLDVTKAVKIPMEGRTHKPKPAFSLVELFSQGTTKRTHDGVVGEGGNDNRLPRIRRSVWAKDSESGMLPGDGKTRTTSLVPDSGGNLCLVALFPRREDSMFALTGPVTSDRSELVGVGQDSSNESSMEDRARSNQVRRLVESAGSRSGTKPGRQRSSHSTQSYFSKAQNKKPTLSQQLQQRPQHKQDTKMVSPQGYGNSHTTQSSWADNASRPKRSQSIAIKRSSRCAEEMAWSQNEESNERMYDWATWRMYNRIIDHRRNQRLSLPGALPVNNEQSAAFMQALAVQEAQAVTSGGMSEQLYDGEVFELEI